MWIQLILKLNLSFTISHDPLIPTSDSSVYSLFLKELLKPNTPPPYFGTSSEAASPFLSPALAGVQPLPGEVSWDHPGGAGSTRAEPQSVSFLHDDL